MRKKDKALIDKFQSLLRSGMDYDVNSMYEEAGKLVYVSKARAQWIVNQYYQALITDDMMSLVNESNRLKHAEIVNRFADKFNMCSRESRLMIRYIKIKLKSNERQAGVD